MLRTTRSTRLSSTLAAASIVAMSACKLEMDQTGGRPAETTAPPVVASTESGAAAAVTPTSDSSGGTTRINGTSVTVEYDLGEVAFREKRYGDATQLFSTYVGQRPTNPWGHYMLGLSAWKSGDLPKARESFERTLELDPKHVKSLLNITRVLLDQEQPKEARKRVEVALKLDPTSSEAHRLMGRVQTTLKQNEEAIVSYRLALSHDPKDVWSMNNMALILIQQRKYEDALPPLARAVQIDSTIPVVQNNLGIVLEHLGQYVLATNAYRSALAADSGYTKAVMSLARVNGRTEATTLVSVNLAALGEEFDKKVRTTAVNVAVIPKPAAPPPDK